MQLEDKINNEVIAELEAMEQTEEVKEALQEAREKQKEITHKLVLITWAA